MLFLLLSAVGVIFMIYLCRLVLRFPHLRRMAWRGIRNQKQSSLLTALGLAVSSALISMTLLANGSLTNILEYTLTDQFGRIAYDLPSTNQPALPSSYFDERNVRTISEQGNGDVLPIVGYPATYVKNIGQAAEKEFTPYLYTIGVDWKDAQRFEPALRGIDGEPPNLGEALLSAGAASSLGVREGDEIYVLDHLNKERRLSVKQVVPERGVTGYRGIQRAKATVVVSLETARSLLGIRDPLYTNLLLTDPPSGEWKSEAVRAGYKQEMKDGIGFLTFIFGSASLNAVFIGIVLITSIFKLIAEERKQEIGILRAIGLGKRDVIRLFTIEGLLYGLVSGLIGAAVGWALAYTLIRVVGNSFSTVYVNSNDVLRLTLDPLAFTACITIGLLLAFGCVRAIARKAVDQSIVEALVPEPPAAARLRPAQGRMWVTILAGMVVVAFLALTAEPDIRKQWITFDSIPAVALAVIASIPAAIMLLLGCLSPICGGIQFLFRNSGAATLAIRLAFRNLIVHRMRTGLLMLMFVFVSCFICISLLFGDAMKQIAEQGDPKSLTGGHHLAARDDRALDTEFVLEQMKESEGYDKLPSFRLTAVQQLVWKEVATSWGTFSYKINGIDARFAESNEILLYQRDDRFASDREAWEELARNENVAIVASDALGFAGEQPYGLGKPFTIQVEGKTVTKTMIGVAHVTGYHPESYGIWVNKNILPSLAKDEHAIHSTVFVKLSHPPNGSQIQAFEQLLALQNIHPVTDIVTSEKSYYLTIVFITQLLQGFNVMALCIAFTGLIVVYYRLVRQRSRQTGVLLTVGVRPGIVLVSILLEGFFIGCLGVLLGFSTGTYMGYTIVGTLFENDTATALALPVDQILRFLSISLLLALAFSLIPARKVMRLSPVTAKQITD